MKKLLILLCLLTSMAYGQTPQPYSIFPNRLLSPNAPLNANEVLRLADTSFMSTKANSVTLSQLQTRLNAKQNVLSGTGFVKISGTTISYDNSSYYLASNPNAYVNDSQVSANTNVAANTAARHSAVTIGTGNGLSLSTQILSLGLSSASANGALSSIDWNTFNNKQNALGFTPYNATNPNGYTSNTGTVTNLTATNGAGQTFTITNPTTTPNISLVLTNAAVGLGNVENKSSAMIRGEITSGNVTAALGYTPYNGATNPNGYISTFTETDPTVPSNVKAITGTNISNWNTAYGWGNHASAGYAHLAGTEFFSGYKRFQADAGIDRALYMGSAANDNPSIGDIIQMSNTNDASTTTAGYGIQLGTGSDLIFNSFSGAPGSISFIPRFRMTNGGLLNYTADMGSSYTDRSAIDRGNAYKIIHSETGYTVTLTASGNGSSTTITIPHGITGLDTDSFVVLTANSNAASNFKYATVDATNVNIYYSVAPASGTQNLFYSALIKYVQR